MDFTYDDEQDALREAVRGLIGSTYSDFETRRQTAEADPGFGEKTWAQMAEMGLLGLTASEADGGMGAGPIEQAIVCQELGRVIAPEPYLDLIVLPTALISRCGSDAQRQVLFAPIASGEATMTFADLEPGQSGSHRGSERTVKAEQSGDGWTLTGVKEPVPHGATATHLLVSASIPDGGVAVFGVDLSVAGDTVQREGYSTADAGRAARLEFNGTPATPLNDEVTDQTPAIDAAIDLTRIMAANQSLGAMETLLKLTSEYLKSRKQFGVTLNNFQALTFRAADMYTSVELTHSMVDWATMIAAEGTDEQLAIAADRVAVQTSKAGRHVGKEAIQLHGGIAVTAEYSVGWYTAHLTVLDHLYGSNTEALTSLGAQVGNYGVLDPLA